MLQSASTFLLRRHHHALSRRSYKNPLFLRVSSVVASSFYYPDTTSSASAAVFLTESSSSGVCWFSSRPGPPQQQQQQQQRRDRGRGAQTRPVRNKDPGQWPVEDSSNKNTIGGIIVASEQEGYCYGCGAEFMVGNEQSQGADIGSMTTVEKPKNMYALHQENYKKSLFRNWALCQRCEQLRDVEEGMVGGTDGGDATAGVLDLAPDNKMTAIFREEVSKVRRQKDAVVILCVDAVNVNGTLLSKIRNYVGGNPILLAVTRCDLLPNYVWKGRHPDAIRQIFRDRAKEMAPAAIYLCSEAKNVMREIGGIQQLAHDLWDHLGTNRDPYVIGCANIGKSTLTDILVSGFMKRGQQLGHFDAFLDRKRLEALQQTRITKSALPGTTLANVRVPCFKNHMQALWDTPGLLVDDSQRQLPIRNFAHIRSQRPSQVKPHIYVEHDRKAFALLLMEKGDDVPLLRFEIRLKKTAEGEGPIRVVWNSILDFDSKIVEIDEARQDEFNRQEELPARAAAMQKQFEEEKAKKDAVAAELGLLKSEGGGGGGEEGDGDQQEPAVPESERTEEELAQAGEEKARKKDERKQLKRKIFEEYERRQIEEMGEKEYRQKADEMSRSSVEFHRFRQLSSLEQLHEVVVERDYGLDICIANVGWLGVLMPRTAMIKVFSPNKGIKVGHYDTLALPISWGEYKSSVKAPIGLQEEEEEEEDDDEWEGGSTTTVKKFQAPQDDDMVFLDKPGVPGDMVDDEYALLHGDTYGNVKEDKDDFGFENPMQLGKHSGDDKQKKGGEYSDDEDDEENESEEAPKGGAAQDMWGAYKGEKVGWIWDDSIRRFGTNQLEAGWNPMPESWGGVDRRPEFAARRRELQNEGSSGWQGYERRPQNWKGGNTRNNNNNNNKQGAGPNGQKATPPPPPRSRTFKPKVAASGAASSKPKAAGSVPPKPFAKATTRDQ